MGQTSDVLHGTCRSLAIAAVSKVLLSKAKGNGNQIRVKAAGQGLTYLADNFRLLTTFGESCIRAFASLWLTRASVSLLGKQYIQLSGHYF